MTITICDEHDLRTVGALQQRLLDVISPGARTVLDITAVTAADVGFVQVIEAARRHAAAVGATLCLSAPAPAAVRDVLDRAGFTSDAATSFWAQGADRA